MADREADRYGPAGGISLARAHRGVGAGVVVVVPRVLGVYEGHDGAIAERERRVEELVGRKHRRVRITRLVERRSTFPLLVEDGRARHVMVVRGTDDHAVDAAQRAAQRAAASSRGRHAEGTRWDVGYLW